VRYVGLRISKRSRVALLVALAFGCGAQGAQAYVYWTDAKPGAVARADLDGTAVDTRFIRAGRPPLGVAVDGTHVYWSNATSIGRANLDGSGAEGQFISAIDRPLSLAVDGAHIYWTAGPNRGIGRANLDGSGVERQFITGLRSPLGLAVDAEHIYWAESAVDDHLDGSIGRANLDASGVNDRFITDTWERGALSFDPIGVAVDGSHIFWTNNADGSIGRVDLDRTNPKPLLVRGAEAQGGVAVDGPHIYWTVYGGEPAPQSVIMRAKLDGTGVNRHFITGLMKPGYVAVDRQGPVRPPPRHLPQFLSPDRHVWCDFTASSFCAAYKHVFGRDERSASLFRNGAVRLCHVRRSSLAGACFVNWGANSPVLRYGQRSEANGVLCTSKRNGITCVLDRGSKRGRGFRINRRRAVKVTSRP
jgi:virginiamycin B lyase